MVGTGVSMKDNFSLAFSFFRIVFFTHDVFSFSYGSHTRKVYKRKKPPGIRRFILIPIFLGTSTVYGSNHRDLDLFWARLADLYVRSLLMMMEYTNYLYNNQVHCMGHSVLCISHIYNFYK
jgi:hypothetical protein